MKHFCWLECQWLNKSFINGTSDGLRILWHQPSHPVSILNNTTCGTPSDGASKPIKLNEEVQRRERKGIVMLTVKRNRIDKKPHANRVDILMGTGHTICWFGVDVNEVVDNAAAALSTVHHSSITQLTILFKHYEPPRPMHSDNKSRFNGLQTDGQYCAIDSTSACRCSTLRFIGI